MKQPRLRSITTFGLGHMRPASGTWGSLPPVVIASLTLLICAHYSSLHALGQFGSIWWWVYHVPLILMFLYFSTACIIQGDHAEARWGKDPKQTVADETSGQCIPLVFPPAAVFDSLASAGFTIALAFVAFRVMDIVKPYPAKQIQRAPAGWGILLDDIIAGVYALLLVRIAAASSS